MNDVFRLPPTAWEIYQKLVSFSAELSRTDRDLNIIEQQLEEEEKKTAAERDQAVRPLMVTRQQLDTFISVSRNHLYDPPQYTGQPETPDIGLLNQIMVSINAPGADRRQVAYTLYTHAMAQRAWVEREISRRSGSFTSQGTKNLKTQQAMLADRSFQLYESLRAELDTLYCTLRKQQRRAGFVTAGSALLPVKLPGKYLRMLKTVIFHEFLDEEGFSAPLMMSPETGRCAYLEYDNISFGSLRKLMTARILQAAHNHGDKLKQVLYADPYRLSNPELEPLCGSQEDNESILLIPRSTSQVREMIGGFYQAVKASETAGRQDAFLCVLDGYPSEYSPEEEAMIRELCFNAERLNVAVFLLNNRSGTDSASSQTLEFPAQTLKRTKGKSQVSFQSPAYTATVELSPEYRIRPEDAGLFSHRKEAENLDNLYEHRVTPEQFKRRAKGSKKLKDLPFAVSADGKVLTTDLDFGYLYGIQGSGKSTLFHTLITSIIATLHPDDVELWLVDFKMVEFNRYIRNCPPHVRVVMLDNSPEMVFDLIDRLKEILDKRKAVFSEHNWTGNRDANAYRYMPTTLVLIDEFPVMSRVINEHNAFDYRDRLTELLKLGRQFGMYLIFAGQNYSIGLSGLKEDAKEQIRWRCAMYGPEASDVLSLVSPTETERSLIRGLQNYYALVTKPADQEGTRLAYGKVMYFGSGKEADEAQTALISRLTAGLHPADTYQPDDETAYLWKQPQFFDGNSYEPFQAWSGKMEEDIRNRASSFDPVVRLYPGQPRSMKPLFSLDLREDRDENILICGKAGMAEEAAALVLSLIACFTRMNNHGKVQMLFASRDGGIRHITELASQQPFVSCSAGQGNIMSTLRACWKDVKEEKHVNRLFFIMDYDFVYRTLKQYDGEPVDESDSQTENNPWGEFTGNGGMTFREKLERLERGEKVPEDEAQAAAPEPQARTEYPPAGEMLETIIRKGPELGCHVAAFFRNITDCNEYRREAVSRSRHKVFFPTARDDLYYYVNGQESGEIERLPAFTFRYVGDMTAMSFRPYMHEGVIIDNWQLNGDKLQRVQSGSAGGLE